MQNDFFWTVEEIIELHGEQVDLFGGEHGLHDLGLLESALAMPKATFGGQFLHKNEFEQAAAYLFHLVKNHPFVDGNKRIGALAAFTFLKMRSWYLNSPNDELYDMVLAVAEGRLDKTGIAAFFEANTVAK